MNDIAIKQWNEFIREFPDEAATQSEGIVNE
jgi:hypothetical protein